MKYWLKIPLAEGKGLSLNQAFDIIKGHGDGEIKVETSEGEGAEFVIQLPIFIKS